MLRELTIDGQRIADDTDCYVIAEIGHNHQGDLEKARQLFLRAKECGVHAVKLQKRDNRSLYTKAMYDRPYQHENSFGRTYGEHREVLEFGRERILGIAGIRDASSASRSSPRLSTCRARTSSPGSTCRHTKSPRVTSGIFCCCATSRACRSR